MISCLASDPVDIAGVLRQQSEAREDSKTGFDGTDKFSICASSQFAPNDHLVAPAGTFSEDIPG
jgi:hypothetical protein